MFVVPALGATAAANLLLSSTTVTVGVPVLYVPLLMAFGLVVVAMLAGRGAMRHERSPHRRALPGSDAHVTSHLRDVTAAPGGRPARARRP